MALPIADNKKCHRRTSLTVTLVLQHPVTLQGMAFQETLTILGPPRSARRPCEDRFPPRRSAMNKESGRQVFTAVNGKENVSKDPFTPGSKAFFVFGFCLASRLLNAPMPVFEANSNPLGFHRIEKETVVSSDKAPRPK